MLASFGAGAMAEETENEDILLAEKEMNFYFDDPEKVETHTIYFPEDSDVPYLSLRDWADIMNRLFKALSNDENYPYHLDFSMEDGVGILTREDGYTACFDPEYDVISFQDYDALLRPGADRRLIDILSVDEPAPNEEAKYFQRSEGSYECYGEAVTLNLADYGIELFSDGEDCYVPAQTLSDFMLARYYRNIFYNGEAVFLSRYGGLGAPERPSALGKLFYSVEAGERSEAMAEFSYLNLMPFEDLDEIFGWTGSLPTSYFFDSNGTLMCKPFRGAPDTMDAYEEIINGILSGEEVETEMPDTPHTAANDEGVYRVIVSDTDGNLVKGATIQFCSDTTCNMGKTDENGMAVFAMEEGPIYIIHVLKVPAGYVKNDAEFATDATYCDIYIPLEKAE